MVDTALHEKLGPSARFRRPVSALILQLRLASGLILLSYVSMHLINLALGLHSIALMEDGRALLLLPWKTRIGTALLPVAAFVHAGLGLYSIASRRRPLMSRTDWVQLVLGLLTIPLLLDHVLFVKVSQIIDRSFMPDYTLVLSAYWKLAPSYALQQVLVVVVVWVHAAIGLYSWLVIKPVWRHIGVLTMPLLFLVPILALLGFVRSGKQALSMLAADVAWQDRVTAAMAVVAAESAQLASIRFWALLVYGVVASAAVAIFLYRLLVRRSRSARVFYEDGSIAAGALGLSILEIGLSNRIPHAHVCGGRGRCGTCLVAIVSRSEALSPVDDHERRTLTRVHASEGQRLACQARLVDHSVEVNRLCPVYVDASAARDPLAFAKTVASLSSQNR